jgi:hypothetical protein
MGGDGWCGLVSGFSAYLSLLIDPSTISVVIGSAIGAGLGGAAYGQLFTEFARPYLRTFPIVQPFDGESIARSPGFAQRSDSGH